MAKLKIEYIKIDQLKPWHDNPRLNDETVESVVKSIEAFGYSNPILVRKENNEIIAGHTRIKALQQLGKKEVPVVYLELNEIDAHVLAVFDNKSVENTKWDNPQLADLFTEFDQLNVDLQLTGFDAEEIQDIVIGPTGDPPESPETETKTTCPSCGHVF